MFGNKVGSLVLLLGAASCVSACSSDKDPVAATGGSPSVGGSTSAGASATGGTATAGVAATGGVAPTGGATSGTTSTGGTNAESGGTSAAATGGTYTATGGSSAAATGGSSAATGGAGATGGSSATTGGTTALTPVQQACKSLCAIQAASALDCIAAQCEADCNGIAGAADFPDEFLAMIQCEAQSLTPADFYCSDWALWPPSLTGPAPTVTASPKSACFDVICKSTCDESTSYDGNVCVACGCSVC